MSEWRSSAIITTRAIASVWFCFWQAVQYKKKNQAPKSSFVSSKISDIKVAATHIGLRYRVGEIVDATLCIIIGEFPIPMKLTFVSESAKFIMVELN